MEHIFLAFLYIMLSAASDNNTRDEGGDATEGHDDGCLFHAA